MTTKLTTAALVLAAILVPTLAIAQAPPTKGAPPSPPPLTAAEKAAAQQRAVDEAKARFEKERANSKPLPTTPTPPPPATQPPPPPPPATQTAPPREILKVGESLAVGQYLVASNKAYFAIQQADGNLCVYNGSGPADNRGGIWCTQRAGGTGQYVTLMQDDGNLCTYRGTATQRQGSLWCWSNVGNSGKFFAIMQPDANLCVYRGTGLADKGAALWCHNTNVARAAAPPQSFGDSHLLTTNQTKAAMWVTLYHNIGPGVTPILAAGCVRVGAKQAWFFSMANTRSHTVRAQMTSTPDCSPLPGDKHIVCDTRMAIDSFNQLAEYWNVTLNADAKGCWWSGGRRKLGQ